METKRKVLFCVLNWGIGHATRSIPIIKTLLNEFDITIASDGEALVVLQKAFPNIQSFVLPSYNVVYSASNSQNFKLFTQIPKIKKSIRLEHEAIKALHKQHLFDVVISDNRYGCFLNAVPSIFIGHQLRLIAPFLEGFVNKLHDKWLNRFNEIWQITPASNFFSRLQPSAQLAQKTKTIGWHSRFKQKIPFNKEGKTAFILSGPEPQRSLFEMKILDWCSYQKEEYYILGGQTTSTQEIVPKNVSYLNFGTAEEIEDLLQDVKGIVSRSGYSSIMDWSCTQTPVLLCPTPGQAEQEYMADFFNSAYGIPVVHQSAFENMEKLEFNLLPTFENGLDLNTLLRSAFDGKSKG